MDSIVYNGETIYYLVIRKRNKNLYARLNKDNVVVVTAPYLASKRFIESFVKESYFKLLRRQEKKKKVVDNEGRIKILGEEYLLEEIENMDYLLTLKLKEYLKNRYPEICNLMGINNFPNIIFKKVKGYLGQYNKKKHQITLNLLIGHLDKECVDYVLVHELSHIKYMNHQKEFWKEIEKYLPDYRKLRLRCKKEFVYYENY